MKKIILLFLLILNLLPALKKGELTCTISMEAIAQGKDAEKHPIMMCTYSDSDFSNIITECENYGDEISESDGGSYSSTVITDLKNNVEYRYCSPKKDLEYVKVGNWYGQAEECHPKPMGEEDEGEEKHEDLYFMRTDQEGCEVWWVKYWKETADGQVVAGSERFKEEQRNCPNIGDPCDPYSPNYDPYMCNTDPCDPFSPYYDYYACQGSGDPCDPYSPYYDYYACQGRNDPCDPYSPYYDYYACQGSNDPCNPSSPYYDYYACQGSGEDPCDPYSPYYDYYACMSIGDPCDPSSPNYNPAQCTTDGCTPGASRDECGECVGGNTGKTAKLWYQDLDGDGWGNNAVAKFCANPGSGWADKGGDWNDDCNNTANRSDQCLTYNEFTPYNDPYIGNQQGSDDTFSNLNNPVDVNDVNEIQIGIDLAEPDLIVPAGNPILLGFTADRNPPGGVNASEDMQHGYNGDVTGIWPKFLNTSMYTESEMWRSMSHLVSTCSFLDSDMKAVGAKMIKKFHDREGGQFSDPTLNSRVYSSIQFKNFMKQFGSALKQKLVQANGDIHAISTIDMASVRPTFGGLYNKFHGLQILIHDTQKTDVFLEKYTTLGNIWTATVEVVIHDNFGLDLHDAVTYQDKHDGFPCWYMLQHRYNYLPFETIVRVRLNISSTF